jgi:hypothetical protein
MGRERKPRTGLLPVSERDALGAGTDFEHE